MKKRIKIQLFLILFLSYFANLQALFTYKRKINIRGNDITFYAAKHMQDIEHDELQNQCWNEINNCLYCKEKEQVWCFYASQALVHEVYRYQSKSGKKYVGGKQYSIPFKQDFLEQLNEISNNNFRFCPDLPFPLFEFDELYPAFIDEMMFQGSNEFCELMQVMINDAPTKMPHFEQFWNQEVIRVLQDLDFCNNYLAKIKTISRREWYAAVKDIYNLDIYVVILLGLILKLVSSNVQNIFIISPIPIAEFTYSKLRQIPGCIDAASMVSIGFDNHIEQLWQEYHANRQRFYEMHEIEQLMNIACDLE